jgi:hypothetical protein
MNPYFLPLLKRALLLLVVAVVMMVIISEGAYWLQKDDLSREPQNIELVIPEGTAGTIEEGESPPTIPEEMVFIVGDVLVVKNEDVSDHELGPLWIPAGKSASLVLEHENEYTYSCSFQQSRYFDLTVKSAVNWQDRIQALGFSVPPTWMFLLVYSFVIRPIKLKKDEENLSL